MQLQLTQLPEATAFIFQNTRTQAVHQPATYCLRHLPQCATISNITPQSAAGA